MTIWIDPPACPAHGRLWSHLVSDSSYDELHAFAASNGIPLRGFEGDHYDVPEERHATLVAAGARAVTGRELARILRDSGLRIPKRRHERVVRSTLDAPWLPAGGRADVIVSRQDDAPANTVVVRLALVGNRGLLVVEHSDGGLDLPSRLLVHETPEHGVAQLSAELTGNANGSPAALIGYVRNTVRTPYGDYPWPTPQACFAVYLGEAAHSRAPAAPARWIGQEAAARQLSQRHWWPLLAERLDGP